MRGPAGGSGSLNQPPSLARSWASLLPLPQGEGNRHGDTALATELQLATELHDQLPYQLQARACRAVPFRRQADAVVHQPELGVIGASRLQVDADLPTAFWEGVLEAVDDELAGDQPQRQSTVEIDPQLAKAQLMGDRRRIQVVEGKQLASQLGKVVAEIDLGVVVDQVELAVDHAQRLQPRAQHVERAACLRIR